MGLFNLKTEIPDHRQIILCTSTGGGQIISQDQTIGPGKKGKGLQISEIGLSPTRDLKGSLGQDESEERNGLDDFYGRNRL
jgi:hypothetical protein